MRELSHVYFAIPVRTLLVLRLGSNVYIDNLAASLNGKIEAILHAVQRLGQPHKAESQDQEPAVPIYVMKSRLNSLDGVFPPMSLTLCKHTSGHAAPVSREPVLLKAKTVAKQDAYRAAKFLLYSLQILIWEYL